MLCSVHFHPFPLEIHEELAQSTVPPYTPLAAIWLPIDASSLLRLFSLHGIARYDSP